MPTCATQISAFYDALVGPALQTVELQISAGSSSPDSPRREDLGSLPHPYDRTERVVEVRIDLV
jgi:hypothetical protein